MSVSGWLRGLCKTRQAFEQVPSKHFLDLTKDVDDIPDEHDANEDDDGDALQELLPDPDRRVRRKTGNYLTRNEADEQNVPAQASEAPGNTERSRPPPGLEGVLPPPQPAGPEGAEHELLLPDDNEQANETEDVNGDEVNKEATGTKREAEDEALGHPGKRSRLDLIEVFNLHLQNLIRQRQKKEAKLADFKGADAERAKKAILKEVNNNLGIKAYELLGHELSKKIRKNKPEKIMESRYVVTKKPLEPSDGAKAQAEGLLLDDLDCSAEAKCRRVMKGYSEEAAVDLEFSAPQVLRDSVIFIAQVIASLGWGPGFLDFTQAFHSGDEINRELYCSQPREGIPGAHPEQLLRLLKTCYGLTDGPLAWYRHLVRRLRELGYRPSHADPCVFFLHGGSDEEP